MDNDRHHLFVASRDSDSVLAFDIISTTRLAAIPTGKSPFGLAVNNVSGKVYVANFFGDSVTVISAGSKSVIRTLSFAPYGEPTHVAVDETRNRVYVALHKGGRLAIIDGTTDTLIGSPIEVGEGAFGVAVNPVLNRVYISCRDAKWIRVIDGGSLGLIRDQTIDPSGVPFSLAVDPTLSQLYVAYSSNPSDPAQPNQLLVYHLTSSGSSRLGVLPVGRGGPDGGGGIAVNALTHRVYVTNSLDDSLSILDGQSLTVKSTVPVGDNPMAVTVDPGLGYVFVGNRGDGSVRGEAYGQ